MPSTPGAIRRRRFILGGMAGGAVVAVAPSQALADELTGTVVEGRGGVGAVVRPPEGAVDTATVQVEGEAVDVSLVGFPEGWAIKKGDLLYVDLDRLEAGPYVTTRGSGAGFEWVALNQDAKLERAIASTRARDVRPAD